MQREELELTRSPDNRSHAKGKHKKDKQKSQVDSEVRGTREPWEEKPESGEMLGSL